MIGLWPKNYEGINKNDFISNIQASIIFIMIILLLAIPLVWSLIRVWGDMILMIDNLQITLPVIVASLKLLIIQWKQSAVAFIIKMIAEDWINLRVNSERDVMMRRARILRLFVIGGYSLMVFAFSLIIVLPSFGLHYRLLTNLTAGVRVLPMQGYYFYDTDKSPQFEFTFAVQVITIFLACLTFTSADAFLMLVIFHICGQLENFRHRLLNLVSGDDFANALRYNVETHLRLIRFADNIENVFTILMLLLLFYFSSVFCLYSYSLISVISDEINNKSFSRISFPVIGVIALFTNTFFYCGGGQLMAIECEAIHRALCDLEWYKWKPRESKSLILLMIRTSEPFRLTAGKIFPLSMVTFCGILKTSVGYISFLLAKYN